MSKPQEGILAMKKRSHRAQKVNEVRWKRWPIGPRRRVRITQFHDIEQGLLPPGARDRVDVIEAVAMHAWRSKARAAGGAHAVADRGNRSARVLRDRRVNSSIVAVANHLWSFAVEDNRQDVNATFLQPFLAYTTKTFTLNTESTYDWENRSLTVLLNLS